jgi:hypothetical protein
MMEAYAMPVFRDQNLSRVIVLLFLIALAFQGSVAHANVQDTDGQWEYIGDDEGIALFHATHEVEGLLPFKAVAELDLHCESIVMALVDAERKPGWAPKLKATAIHNMISSNRFEYSEYYTTPWPFKDREFLLLGTVIYDRDRVVFSAVNSENSSLAKQDHLTANIRELTFSVIPVSQSRTRVEFTFSGDLGGWIPAFVKTIIQKRWPVRFIQALQKHVSENDGLETERYRSLKKTAICGNFQ